MTLPFLTIKRFLMYKLLSFIAIFLVSISHTNAQSLGAVSLTYKGLFGTETDEINDQSVKFKQNTISFVAAATITNKIAAGYIFGIDNSIEEMESDGTKIHNKSFMHGAVIRHYFPIVDKVVGFTDLIYLRQLYEPMKTEFTNNDVFTSDLEQKSHKIKLVYGFAFYIKRNISFDLKMNLALYEIADFYQKEAETGEMIKTETSNKFEWNLNGFSLSKATIGVRYIIR
jgi:hypothetical protein